MAKMFRKVFENNLGAHRGATESIELIEGILPFRRTS